MGSRGIDPYCHWLARYFFVPGMDADDLFQEARIAAWLAPSAPRTAARRRILDLLKFSQRRPLIHRFDHSIIEPSDVVEIVAARETLRRIVTAPLTRNEAIALGRAARGEPIRRSEKSLGVAYWRARRRLVTQNSE